MKVIIAGTRTITDPQVITEAMRASGFVPTLVVSGGAIGVDRLGETWAQKHHLPIRRFKPDWTSLGRAAGPRRNADMAEFADALVAVWDGASKGTADMISKMRRAGKPVHIHFVHDIDLAHVA